MRLSSIALAMPSSANAWSLARLFADSSPGAHFEAYDPQKLLARRNQLTYSSQFSNAAWSRGAILSITSKADGVGDLIVPNTTSAVHSVQQNISSVGVAETITFRAKAGGYNFVVVQIGDGTNGVAYFNVSTGTLGTVSGAATASIVAAAGAAGYYDCTLTCPAVVANGNFLIGPASANSTATFAGDGVSGIYLARAQMEYPATTPSAYQDVTDWNTEYMAAALAGIGMWQDSLGTTPVTAVEQPVGKWVDKSGNGKHATQATSTSRPVLSARVNLLTKTEQPDDAAWTKVECTAVGATITGSANSGVSKSFKPASPATAGTTQYVWSARLTAGTQRYVQVLVANDSNIYVNVDLQAGTFSIGGSRAANATVTMVAAGGGFDFKFTYVSDQATAQMGQVFIVDSMAALRAATTTALSTTYQITRIDLRTSDDAAKNIPAYQRVNTSTDYATAGFPHYLKFDGIDDCLFTGSIDFTGVNKMSVWLGVSKLSDAAAAVAVELTASTSGTDGGFVLATPTSVAANYGFSTRGTVAIATRTATTFTAPVTSLMFAALDNSQATIALQVQPRVNGVVPTLADSAGPTSAGNFANAPLYIGRRNNATNPVNDRFYSLTVRGSTTPTGEGFIANMNRYAANLMAITI